VQYSNNHSRNGVNNQAKKQPPSRSRNKSGSPSYNCSSNKYDSRNRRPSDRGTKELHTTTCSKCKKETQVPFKPTGSKPVYCRECFQDQKLKDGSADKRRSPSRSMSRPNYQSSTRSSGRYEDRSRNRTNRKSIELHTVICSKCKKETQVPFKPTRSKPVYCRECFQDQKTKGEPTQVTEVIKDNNDEVVERFGDRAGPYRANKRMHSTTCKTCNKEIMIPFKPKESKPTYCQNCFQKVGKKK